MKESIMSRVAKAVRDFLTRGSQIRKIEERVIVAESKPPKKRVRETAGAA